MIVCLIRYLNIFDLLIKGGGIVYFKEVNNILFIFICLMEYLSKVEDLIKFGVSVN